MYGRNPSNTNIFNRNSSNAQNSNNNSYNNTNSYNNRPNNPYGNSNSYGSGSSYGNYSNGPRIGSNRLKHNPNELSRNLQDIVIQWKGSGSEMMIPSNISCRYQTIHLAPTQIRIQDYFLIRKSKLESKHQRYIRDAIASGSFNPQLTKDSATNSLKQMSFFNDKEPDIQSLKQFKRNFGSNSVNSNQTSYNSYSSYSKDRYGTSSNNNSYGNYGNNNSSNNNNSSYGNYGNNNSSNNIFSSNSGNNANRNIFSNSNSNNNGTSYYSYNNYSNNNNSSSGNNIFKNNSSTYGNSNNSGSNNIFSNNNNSSSNNPFARNNNNNSSYSSYNIFSNNNNTANNNNSSNYNTRSSNNIFNGNNNNSSGGNNIFNKNNNSSSGNNIFSNNNSGNNNSGNPFMKNNNSSGNSNIFSNNNSNGNNIFSNGRTGNNIFSNNNSNGGNNIFNNGNNGQSNNIFNKNNSNGYNGQNTFGNTPDLSQIMLQQNSIMARLCNIINQKSGKNNKSSFINTTDNLLGNNFILPLQSFDFDYQAENQRKLQEHQRELRLRQFKSRDIDRGFNQPPMIIQFIQKSQKQVRNKGRQNNSMMNKRNQQSYLNTGSNIFENNQNKITSSIFSNNREQNFIAQNEDQQLVQLHYQIRTSYKEQPELTTLVQGQIMIKDINSTAQYTKLLQKIFKEQISGLKSDGQLTLHKPQYLKGNFYQIKGKYQQRKINLPLEYSYQPTLFKGFIVQDLQISNQHGTITWAEPINISEVDFSKGLKILKEGCECSINQLDKPCVLKLKKISQNVIKYRNQPQKALKKINNFFNKINNQRGGKFEATFINFDPPTSWMIKINGFPKSSIQQVSNQEMNKEERKSFS